MEDCPKVGLLLQNIHIRGFLPQYHHPPRNHRLYFPLGGLRYSNLVHHSTISVYCHLPLYSSNMKLLHNLLIHHHPCHCLLDLYEIHKYHLKGEFHPNHSASHYRSHFLLDLKHNYIDYLRCLSLCFEDQSHLHQRAYHHLYHYLMDR